MCGFEESISTDKNKGMRERHFKISLDKKPKRFWYWFTRLVFGLIQSPFILEAILQSHLSKYEKTYPKEIEVVKKSMYIDDMISGGNNEAEVVYLRIAQKQYLKRSDLYYKNGIQIIPG